MDYGLKGIETSRTETQKLFVRIGICDMLELIVHFPF